MDRTQLKEKLQWYIAEDSTPALLEFISDVAIRYDIYSEISIFGNAFVGNFGKDFMTKIGENVDKFTLGDLYNEILYEYDNEESAEPIYMDGKTIYLAR